MPPSPGGPAKQASPTLRAESPSARPVGTACPGARRAQLRDGDGYHRDASSGLLGRLRRLRTAALSTRHRPSTISARVWHRPKSGSSIVFRSSNVGFRPSRSAARSLRDGCPTPGIPLCCVTNPEPPATRGRSANQRIFAARPVGGSAGLRAAPFSGPPFGLLAKNGYVAA